MPEVRLFTTAAGPEGCHPAGAVISVSAEQAEQLVSGNFAEYVGRPPVSKPAAPTQTPDDEPPADESSTEAVETSEAAVEPVQDAADKPKRAKRK